MDYFLFTAINQFAGQWAALDEFFKAIASYGVLLMAVPLLFMWFRGDNDAKKAALLSFAAVGVAMLVNQLIGAVYFRPRPFSVHEVNLIVAPSADPSFPSDHAAFVFAIASMVAIRERFHSYVTWMALGIAVLVSISRVFIGLHYPLDIAGGALVGLAAAYGVWLARGLLDPVTSFLVSIARKLRLA